MEQHIGLGKSARIVNIEVWWPATNTRQNFTNVVTDQFLEIKESVPTYTKLERNPIHLGGANREVSAANSARETTK